MNVNNIVFHATFKRWKGSLIFDSPYVYRKWYSFYNFFFKQKGTLKDYFLRKRNMKKLYKEAINQLDNMPDRDLHKELNK